MRKLQISYTINRELQCHRHNPSYHFRPILKGRGKGFSATLHVDVDCSEIVGVTGMAELFLGRYCAKSKQSIISGSTTALELLLYFENACSPI